MGPPIGKFDRVDKIGIVKAHIGPHPIQLKDSKSHAKYSKICSLFFHYSSPTQELHISSL
jgi:hypothetical protein